MRNKSFRLQENHKTCLVTDGSKLEHVLKSASLFVFYTKVGLQLTSVNAVTYSQLGKWNKRITQKKGFASIILRYPCKMSQLATLWLEIYPLSGHFRGRMVCNVWRKCFGWERCWKQIAHQQKAPSDTVAPKPEIMRLSWAAYLETNDGSDLPTGNETLKVTLWNIESYKMRMTKTFPQGFFLFFFFLVMINVAKKKAVFQHTDASHQIGLKGTRCSYFSFKIILMLQWCVICHLMPLTPVPVLCNLGQVGMISHEKRVTR